MSAVISAAHPNRAPVGARSVRLAVVAALAAVAAALGVPSTAGAQGVPALCPPVVPVEELAAATAGKATISATGLTVSSGDEPEPFVVEVIGILPDGIGPDRDMIIARVDSPAIDRARGIWAGMSGSPVYAADGRLIGAVAYGFSAGPSKLGGLTPAEDMMQVLDEGVTLPATTTRRSVELPAALAEKARLPLAGRSAADAGRLSQLPLPLAVSGVSAERFPAFAASLPARLGPTVAYRVGAPPIARDDPAQIQPGGNFAAAASYGDFSLVGVGTTTAVCDRFALAFGHPMQFSGRSTLSAHTADALAVVDDPLFGPFKLASVGGVVGTVDQDRLTAIRARLGVVPTPIPVSSTVVDADRARTRDGLTNVNDQSYLALVAANHLVANFDRVLDRIGPGRAHVRWTVTGNAGGRPFELARENRHAAQPGGDIAFAAADELYAAIAAIEANRFADVEFTGVRIDATVRDTYRAYRIEALERRQGTSWARIDPDVPLRVTPGQELRLRLRLSSYRDASGTRYVERTVQVPADTAPGTMATVRIRGGASPDEGEGPADEPESFDELLESFRDALRNDQILAEATVSTDPESPPSTIASIRETLDEVVTGSLSFQAEVQAPA